MELQKSKKSIKLQPKNTKIKNLIVKVLKENLSISKKEIKILFLQNSPNIGAHSYYCSVSIENLGYHNYKTIVDYLTQNGLATKEKINGFWFLVATKKLVHSNLDKC